MSYTPNTRIRKYCEKCGAKLIETDFGRVCPKCAYNPVMRNMRKSDVVKAKNVKRVLFGESNEKENREWIRENLRSVD